MQDKQITEVITAKKQLLALSWRTLKGFSVAYSDNTLAHPTLVNLNHVLATKKKTQKEKVLQNDTTTYISTSVWLPAPDTKSMN